MAFRDGKPLCLSALGRELPGLAPEETVVYAPTAGVQALRTGWKEGLLRKNPSLKGSDFSLPVVVPGITAGISYIADLFLDEGQTILAGEPSWDNYGLIFAERRGAILRGIPLFGEGRSGPGLDLAAFEAALEEEAASGTVRIILNFPHNPSGYTPSRAEAEALLRMVEKTAASGAPVLAICDDAYFGLFYEEETAGESLFGRLASLHDKVLAVKIDGPTKEDYVWGLRIAFISIGGRGLDEAARGALEKKLMGAIRSSVSCANTSAQYLALKTAADPATAAEKGAFFELLQSRYRAVKDFLAKNPPPPGLEILPFNSGYFMCFRCRRSGAGRAGPGAAGRTGSDAAGRAEAIRQILLKKGIGAIALGDEYLRITFAAVEEAEIPGLYRAVYEAAKEAAG
jgi:aspartate/methionine/tyrosine aminotransferase